ncbi:MAG: amidohydrolase family protein [Gemmataceae bacterium]|nr:amidohydrolase family protein [Gemmataceae bacterium]
MATQIGCPHGHIGGLVFALMWGLTTTPARAQDGALAFRGATIETAGKAGRIEKGTLVLRGGKIEAVGTDVKIPEDARVLDVPGQTILPGIIDPFREVNIAGAAADTGPRTIVIGRRGITLGGRPAIGGGGFTRVADNFYPYESGYRVLLRSGLTGLNLVTSGHGQAAVVQVTPSQPEAMLLNPDGFVYTAVNNDSSSLDIIRTALATVVRVKQGGSLPATPAAGPPTPERRSGPLPGRRGGRNPRGGGPPAGGAPIGLNATTLKLWQAVHEGKAPLLATASNAAAIVHLLKALEPYKDVKLVLVASGPSLYETLDRLRGRQVRIIVRPDLSLKPHTRDRIAVAPLLHEAGLEFAFTHPLSPSELLASQDFPLFAVAYLIKCGLPRQVALQALTARPAALLGLDQKLGTIEPNKSANLLIFQGDPLDPDSQLSQVLIEGRTVYDN